jgi:hypothetical protein
MRKQYAYEVRLQVLYSHLIPPSTLRVGLYHLQKTHLGASFWMCFVITYKIKVKKKGLGLTLTIILLWENHHGPLCMFKQDDAPSYISLTTQI